MGPVQVLVEVDTRYVDDSTISVADPWMSTGVWAVDVLLFSLSGLGEKLVLLTQGQQCLCLNTSTAAGLQQLQLRLMGGVHPWSSARPVLLHLCSPCCCKHATGLPNPAQVRFNTNLNSFAHLSTNGCAKITANVLI